MRRDIGCLSTPNFRLLSKLPLSIRFGGRDPESALDSRRNRGDFRAVTYARRIQRLRRAQIQTREAGRCCWLAGALLTEGDTIF